MLNTKTNAKKYSIVILDTETGEVENLDVQNFILTHDSCEKSNDPNNCFVLYSLPDVDDEEKKELCEAMLSFTEAIIFEARIDRGLVDDESLEEIENDTNLVYKYNWDLNSLRQKH